MFIINFFNELIFYYFNGPMTEFVLYFTWCENGLHKFLQKPCYKNTEHIIDFNISIILLLITFIISLIYCIYCNEIGLITTNITGNMARIDCKYELFSFISKEIIFFGGYFVKRNEFLLNFCLELSCFYLPFCNGVV